jgi:general secretion pathway protein B
MSLILEALKKSEAKRRLGEAPDLGTPFAAPRPRRGLLPFIVAAIVIAGGIGWWLTRTRAPAPQAASIAVPAPTLNHPVPHNQPAAATAAQSRSAAPAATPPKPEVFWVDAQRPGSTQRAMTPHTAVRQRASVQPAPVPPTAPATKPSAPIGSPPQPMAIAANNPLAAKPANAGDGTLLKKAAKSTSTIGLTPTPAPAPTPTPTPTPAQAPATTPATASASAQSYSDLPFSLRKALPEIKLSMHVYAADAAQRFVILNDSRMLEGDKTADDVILREVRPDGVVLEFQGQRFFYPRDGL